MHAARRAVTTGRRAAAPVARSLSTSGAELPEWPEPNPKLQIFNPTMRDSILHGVPENGPYTKSRKYRKRYETPAGLNEVFPLAYKLLAEESARLKALRAEYEKKLSTAPAEEQKELAEFIESLEVKSEIGNPEVLYNFETKNYDLTEPVYRHLRRQEWESYELMLVMQRLEQLHVIPDTLPTIEPRANLKVKFITEHSKWVEPGEKIYSRVTQLPPVFAIEEFEPVPAGGHLYTVLIVDPDTPDLEGNTYSTTLQYAVANVPVADNTDTEFGLSKLSAADELMPYQPAVPEKNAPAHRSAVWLLRQPEGKPLAKPEVTREHFDIRAFVADNGLDPVAANVYRSVWDRNTEAVRAMYNLPEGNVYRRVRR